MNNPSKLSDTDLCVMCGMCLPHCPTYQIYQTETESPRGRIALMQSIDQHKIKADSAALKHIDHCLGCLNCESICPSGVPYGKLIDEFRDQYSDLIKKPLFSKFILNQLKKNNGIARLSQVASKPLIRQTLELSGKLTGIPSGFISENSPDFADFYPTDSTSKGQVSIFAGCTGKINDHQTLTASLMLINQLGFDVLLPQQAACCGAIHQHNGQQQTASELLSHTKTQLLQHKSSVILFLSPACGAFLSQLKNTKILDIRTFLDEQLQQQALRFSTPTKAIVLHESCSQRNHLKLTSANRKLLAHIPDIKILTSSQPSLCCGAGGLQSINYPEQAKQLAEKKYQSFDFTHSNLLISDNIGCSLHMKSAFSAYNSDIEILHPVSLLARQLITGE